MGTSPWHMGSPFVGAARHSLLWPRGTKVGPRSATGFSTGAFFFNVSIHDVIQSCPGDFDWNLWFMDDRTLRGRREALETALVFLQKRLEAIGLIINLHNCTLWGPLGSSLSAMDPTRTSTLQQVSQLPRAPGSGTVLLGVPVHFPADPSFARQTLHATLEKVKQACAVLLALGTHRPNWRI